MFFFFKTKWKNLLPEGEEAKKKSFIRKKRKSSQASQFLVHIVRLEKNNVKKIFLQLSLMWHAIIISGSVSKWLETLLSAIFPKIWELCELFCGCTWNQLKMGAFNALFFFWATFQVPVWNFLIGHLYPWILEIPTKKTTNQKDLTNFSIENY